MSTGVDPARWEMIVGLEVHVQLKTRTKIFCGCTNEFGAPPNRNTCPICLALPGALPALNEKAVELAVRAAIALCCSINATSVFARKNYFYPDSPKGYQISQFDKPLATGGYLDIGLREDASPIRIGITRVHMEEDAGKSIHDRYESVSAIDLNRSGAPLIEIVSEPDMHSAEHAGAYCRVLKQILEYIDVSDVNMEKGSLRVDANVSARRRGESKLGTKTEIKNLNSFSAVERALNVEFARQIALLEAGHVVAQQTMLWDERAQTVTPSRTKEGSHDYRYFPEPDLPPLILSPDFVDKVRKSIPELPAARRARFATDYSLSAYDTDVLIADSFVSDFFEGVARAHGDAKAAANFVMGEVLAHLRTTNSSVGALRARPADVAQLLDLVRDEIVGVTAAKKVFARMLETGESAPQIAHREGHLQVRDTAELSDWLDQVSREMPKEWDRWRAGDNRLTGVLVGAVMKKSNGRADPKLVAQLLAARLGS